MSIRVNRSLSLKERKLYTFGNFRGVDFSTSPYLVQKNRAISAQNLIYENGTVRKRTGWKSVCKLPGRINGIFTFEIDDTNFILAYAGTRFYLLTWDSVKNRYKSSDITGDIGGLVDRRIQLYVNKNKAYIVGCGDYLVFGKWANGNYELRRVFDNEDTYIPTTTINIDPDGVNDEHRASVDDVNILSPYRKNKLLGSAENSSWYVDTAIKGVSQAIDDNSDITILVEKLEEDIVITNNGLDKTELYNGDSLVGGVEFATGKITLNIDTTPPETNTANITITFKKSEPGKDDFVKNATISTLFGGSGNSNRLFISGSSTSKNVHIWSEMYDFTYFPDNNYDELGSDSSAILGYVRASDGVLLTFKEKNGSDSSLYYVSGTDTTEEDYEGNLVFKTLFHKSSGNITDTIYGKYASASLNGDNLILTRNGVKGLELYENLSTSAYRIRERSRNINSKLLQHKGLDDACAIAYQDKYYLSVDGVVYVCDSRFTFSAEEDISDSFNYEWWYFTNVDARVWSEIDNKLFFGTSDGKICVFTENEYVDTTYQDTGEGMLGIDYINNQLFYNQYLEKDLNNSTNIVLNGSNTEIYSLLLNKDEITETDAEGWLYIKEETLYKVFEGLECYADNVEETGLEIDKEYVIQEVDLDNLRFRLVDKEGNTIIPASLGFVLCKIISGKSLFLTNIQQSDDLATEEVEEERQVFQVKEFENGEVLILHIYNYRIPEIINTTITFKDNVIANWYTPIYDLGSNMYSKTLLGLTITTEPLVKGKVALGYQTRNIEKDFITYGNRGFDFNDIDFEDFSFESTFTNSNTLRVKERNFNFIILRYISDTNTACAVNGITIRYKINRINKGIR